MALSESMDFLKTGTTLYSGVNNNPSAVILKDIWMVFQVVMVKKLQIWSKYWSYGFCRFDEFI
jgi:hypothetical protein